MGFYWINIEKEFRKRIIQKIKDEKKDWIFDSYTHEQIINGWEQTPWLFEVCDEKEELGIFWINRIREKIGRLHFVHWGKINKNKIFAGRWILNQFTNLDTINTLEALVPLEHPRGYDIAKLFGMKEDSIVTENNRKWFKLIKKRV